MPSAMPTSSAASPPDARIAPARPRRAPPGQGARHLRRRTTEHLLIVTTDRLSAFDVVLPDPIPGKGRVLTSISNFWFGRTRHIVPNHLQPTARSSVRCRIRPSARRSRTARMVVRRLQGAAGRGRGARLPDRLGLEGLPAHRRGLRHRAARRACGMAERAAASRSSRPSTKAARGAPRREHRLRRDRGS